MFFGMPMGLLGVALELRHLEKILGWELRTSFAFMFLSWGLFISMLLFAMWTCRHQQGRSFYKSQYLETNTLLDFSILTLSSMMLTLSFSLVFVSLPKEIWQYLFLFVVALHTLLNLKILGNLIFLESHSVHISKPAMFVLLSGNFMVVIVGKILFPEMNPELWWFFFSIGLTIWLIFFFLIFYRFIFHSDHSPQLRPAFFIFLSPPSLAVVAYIHLNDLVVSNGFLYVLMFTAVTMFLVILIGVIYFVQAKLSMGAWAYIYPLASFDLGLQFFFVVTEQIWAFYLAIAVMVLNLLLASLMLSYTFKHAVIYLRQRMLRR